MKIINKKKLIFEFEDTNEGIMVMTRTKGKLNLNHIMCAKKFIDSKLKDYGKNKRK